MKDILGRELRPGMPVAHVRRSSTRVHAEAGRLVDFVDVSGNWNYHPETQAAIVVFPRRDGQKRSKPILGRNLLILREDGFDV